MHTIILNSDKSAKSYLTFMLEHINTDIKYNTVIETADALAQLGKDVQLLLSTDPNVAFKAFRDQFRTGCTMMFVSPEDEKNLERWSNENAEFQIAVFAYDGKPVGLYGKDVISW